MGRKKVNLDGGLNEQDATINYGFDEFQELENARRKNGMLVKRFGTKAATTISAYLISQISPFVDRRLHGVVINASTSNYTFTNATKKLALGATTGVTIPGSTSKDWSTVFAVGDTVWINADSSTNDGIFTISDIDEDEMTFERAPADQGAITSGTLQIAFASFEDSGLGPLNVLDADSYNGKALAVSSAYLTGNSKISIFSAQDFSNHDMITDLGYVNADMRQTTYSDAVRFTGGVDQDAYILKYINRNHFNGMFKTAYNTNINHLYPSWRIEAAMPAVPSSLIGSETIEVISGDNTDSTHFIKGALNLTDDDYRYKFVPVYDGVQEDILENSIVEFSTETATKREEEPSGVLSTHNCAAHMNMKLDLTHLNKRMSSINIYRSRNNGPYYKIKTCYMGDNNDSQQLIETVNMDRSVLYWTGGPSAPGTDALDDKFIYVDGFQYIVDNGTCDDDFQSTGYNQLQFTSGAAANFGSKQPRQGANAIPTFNPFYYGNKLSCLFNKPSKQTDIIFANNGDVIGGDVGGWYIAENNDNPIEVTLNAASGGAIGNITVGGTDGFAPPMSPTYITTNTGLSAAFHARYDATASELNLKYGIISESLDITPTDYIISGWIQVEGMNSPDHEWRVFIDQEKTVNTTTSTGDQIIAEGMGGDVNQNIDKWRYFQYQVEAPSDGDLYYYIYMKNPTGTASSGGKIHLKNFQCRQIVTNYDLNSGLVGFGGENLLIDTNIADLNIPRGLLKGNRIVNDDGSALFPVDTQADETFISDNLGPFIQTVDSVPDITNSATNQGWHLSTNNYQFYLEGTDNTADTDVFLDFIDVGLPDGARHPSEAASSRDVKFKYATMLNGRQFVGNVRITSEGEKEDYPHFVMFSNPGAPDVIPVSNFIQVQDLQGGEIVGLETLMGDIVVFMTNGIFRLSVPSSDPFSWSLVEAHPHIGCLHADGIVKTLNGIYFLSQQDVIFLDSGFTATPISYKIRDNYQLQTSAAPSTLKLHHDVKNHLLLLLYSNTTTDVGDGGVDTVIYVYDIQRSIWSKDTFTDQGFHGFGIDDQNQTLLVNVGATDSKVGFLEDTTEYRDYFTGTYEGIIFKMKTGKEMLTSFDNNVRIRRLNTELNDGGAGAFSFDVVVTTNNGSISKDNALSYTQSTRLSSLVAGSSGGARGNVVEIELKNSTNEDDEKEITYVDIEYE